MFNGFCIDVGSQVGSKIHQEFIQKSIQEAPDLVIDFDIDLWSLFDGNYMQQRTADTPKNIEKPMAFLQLLLYLPFCLDILLASFFDGF